MTAIDIALLGCDGSRWDIAGRFAGRQGAIIAAEQVQGIYDAPLEIERDQSADGIGEVQVGPTRYKAREMNLGLHLFEDDYPGPHVGGSLESAFRQAIAADVDRWDPAWKPTRLVATTELSGVRMLAVQMYEAPDIDLGDDRIDEEYFNAKYALWAGMPLWASKTKVTVFEAGSTSASGAIEVSNPTDMVMRQTWRLTRATWTLPDPSWSGAKRHRAPGGDHPTRTLTLPPILSTDGGVILTRERTKRHAETFTGANFQARMGLKWLQFDIPPYTPPTQLPISYAAAPAGGARAELHQPRLWSRPWGME